MASDGTWTWLPRGYYNSEQLAVGGPGGSAPSVPPASFAYACGDVDITSLTDEMIYSQWYPETHKKRPIVHIGSNQDVTINISYDQQLADSECSRQTWLHPFN